MKKQRSTDTPVQLPDFPPPSTFIPIRFKKRGGKAAKSEGGKRRKRAKITDEIRAELKNLAEAGKSGSEIAAALGISLPSVQNIKKALGLVKSRS